MQQNWRLLLFECWPHRVAVVGGDKEAQDGDSYVAAHCFLVLQCIISHVAINDFGCCIKIIEVLLDAFYSLSSIAMLH
jgi:hypothetical protein